MHIAQGRRKAAYDEVRDRLMQVLVSDGIAGGWRLAVVDLPAGAWEPDLRCIVQRRGGAFFDNGERLAVDNPDFVERMDLVVRFQHRTVSDQTNAFDLPATAAEIRFCFCDDDIGVEPLRRHFSLNEFLEGIATNEVDG